MWLVHVSYTAHTGVVHTIVILSLMAISAQKMVHNGDMQIMATHIMWTEHSAISYIMYIARLRLNTLIWDAGRMKYVY